MAFLLPGQSPTTTDLPRMRPSEARRGRENEPRIRLGSRSNSVSRRDGTSGRLGRAVHAQSPPHKGRKLNRLNFAKSSQVTVHMPSDAKFSRTESIQICGRKPSLGVVSVIGRTFA